MNTAHARWLFAALFVILLGAAALLLLVYPLRRESTDLAVRAQAYCDMENVAGVEISRSAGMIKVISSLLGGGADYYPENGGQPTVCPVVGPDAMSDECRALLDVNDWEVICGTAQE